MRTIQELVNVEEPAWPMVQAWIAEARNPIEILPVDSQRRAEALVRTQVTTRSPMGAILYESGGLWVDGGWLRVLGSGTARMRRSLPEWNETCAGAWDGGPPPLLLVADDAVGGFFAVNGGALDGPPGAVFYFAPDALAWEELSASYSDFLHFCFNGDLERFYSNARWPSWRQDLTGISGDAGFLIYPFLWADGPPVGERERKPVPLLELWKLQQSFVSQLQGG